MTLQRLVTINAVLSVIFLTRGARDLATSQSWFLSIWNQLDLNGRVTSCAFFVFFCFWEFLPTVLLLCLISSKAGGVGGASLSLGLPSLMMQLELTVTVSRQRPGTRRPVVRACRTSASSTSSTRAQAARAAARVPACSPRAP